MNKKILVTLLTGALGALTTQADWTVVSTFDDDSALSLITDVINIEGGTANSTIVDGKWAVNPGELYEATSNLFTLLDMGVDLKAASISSNGPVTVYLELIQPMVDDGAGGMRKAIVDTVWGISNYDPPNILGKSFNLWNAMQRINSGNDSFEGRNGTGYEIQQQFQADVTYKIWLVIDYTLNFYETYIQGGQWTEQTRLDTADMSGIWLFRVNPAPEDLCNYFLIGLSAGTTLAPKGLDPTYFDNISVDTTGQNLTTPDVGGGGFGKWGPFDVVDAAGNVDTGTWMGYVNVAAKPYIWSYSLNAYTYIDEAGITSGGSWVYVFN